MTELKNKPLSEWTLAEAKEYCEKLENTCEGCPFNFHPDCALNDFPSCWSLPEKTAARTTSYAWKRRTHETYHI